MIKISKKFCMAMVVISVALLIVIDIFRPVPFESSSLNDSFFIILTRLIGTILFLIMIVYLEYDVLKAKYMFGKSALCALPCFVVAINNLPYVALILGDAHIDGTAAEIIFFALECIFVASFEELAFRGVLFSTLMQKCGSRRQVFKAIIISSVIFGLFHLVNLIDSKNVGGVLLQVGYSTLVGAMCAYVLFKTKSVWLCTAVHAIYNFCGQIVPRLGGGNMLNAPQIIITVIIAIFCTIHIVKSILNSNFSAVNAPQT